MFKNNYFLKMFPLMYIFSFPIGNPFIQQQGGKLMNFPSHFPQNGKLLQKCHSHLSSAGEFCPHNIDENHK